MAISLLLALQVVEVAGRQVGTDAPDVSALGLAFQVVILAGVVWQGVMQILYRRWAIQDRRRQQVELLAAAADTKREVVATTRLQLDVAKSATSDILAAVNGHKDK